MDAIKVAFILIVGMLHLYFFYLECFLWSKPKGLEIFRLSLEQAQSSATLASNQGVYNALLGVGLFLSLFLQDPYKLALETYILSFISIVGIYGGITVSPKIILIQTIPAILALFFVLVF